MSNISHTNEGIKDINKNYNYLDIEQALRAIHCRTTVFFVS